MKSADSIIIIYINLIYMMMMMMSAALNKLGRSEFVCLKQFDQKYRIQLRLASNKEKIMSLNTLLAYHNKPYNIKSGIIFANFHTHCNPRSKICSA